MTSTPNAVPILVLGSTSQFRKELLERLMVPFEVASPNIDETPKPGESPITLVERLAIEKAGNVVKVNPTVLVFGQD